MPSIRTEIPQSEERRNKMKGFSAGNAFRNLYFALILLFLYAPIVFVIIFSFNAGDSRGIFEGFSFQWYEKLFQNDELLDALGNTLIIAVASSLIATVIGTYAAIIICKMSPLGKRVTMIVNNIPMLNAEIVVGISLMMLFTFISMPLGFTSLLLAHISFNIPYVVLSVLPRVRGLNTSTYEAALDLGASPVRAFLQVTLPEIMPGVISGLLMAFTLSLDDVIISYFTAGSEFITLSVMINSMTKRSVPLTVNALSALMFVAVFILLLLINFRKPDKEKQ